MPDTSEPKPSRKQSRTSWFSRLFYWMTWRHLLVAGAIGAGCVVFAPAWQQQAEQLDDVSQIDELDFSAFEKIEQHAAAVNQPTPFISENRIGATKTGDTTAKVPEWEPPHSEPQMKSIQTIHFENASSLGNPSQNVVQGAYLVGEIIPSTENQ